MENIVMSRKSKSNLPLAEAVHTDEFDPALARLLLQKALEFSETMYGNDSPEAGSCLMEFADYLENSGDMEEAEILTLRYHLILISIARKLNIS